MRGSVQSRPWRSITSKVFWPELRYGNSIFVAMLYSQQNGSRDVPRLSGVGEKRSHMLGMPKATSRGGLATVDTLVSWPLRVRPFELPASRIMSSISSRSRLRNRPPYNCNVSAMLGLIQIEIMPPPGAGVGHVAPR